MKTFAALALTLVAISLSHSSGKVEPVSALLNSSVVDHIDFHNRSITNIVSDMRRLSIKLDPSGLGVNFRLYQRPMSDGEKEPSATASFDDIPLAQLLRYVCEQLDYTWSLDENGVTICSTGLTSEPFEIQLLSVHPSRLGFQKADGDALKQMALGFGLKFPRNLHGEEATVVWDPKSATIIHRNTRKNLDLFSALLGPHRCPLSQVITTVDLVKSAPSQTTTTLVSVSALSLDGNESSNTSRSTLNLGDSTVYVDAQAILTTHSQIDGQFISSDLHVLIGFWSSPEACRTASELELTDLNGDVWQFNYQTEIVLRKGADQTIALPGLPGSPKGTTYSLVIRQDTLGPKMDDRFPWEHDH